ncbi:hypothetical protein ACLI4U_03790 [Natrialbaceae archaeon A-CW2]|uniref:hypothetical protein n=1 Tax=Natronosalvus amylolyticus TaxID=2961994 RepID=UPI0020C9A573|nr:hypothetical protein [Natronosalvus amylolyticus]
MIEWEVDRDHLRVVDADNTELHVQGRTLDVSVPGPDIERPVDRTVVATTTELQFPHAIVYAFSLADDERKELEPDGSPLRLPPGEYVLDIDTEIKTYLRFSGRATIRRTADYSRVVVTFPERTRTILGFRSRHELPADTITVPDTPAGVARGVSCLSASIKTTSPDRTYPTLRGHPPLLETEPSCSSRPTIPDGSGVELLVPPCYESVFVVAPLAYYLQATVRTEHGITPRLRLPSVAREHELEPMPALERTVEQLLRQCFFLDCLVRNAGPYGSNLAEMSLLRALEMDESSLYTATPQERLAAYLDVPFSAIEHRIPPWHLSMYVEPEPDSTDALPYLLDRLSLVFTPQTSRLEGRELVERSLDDFYRGDSRGIGQVASVDIVKPELRGGRVHGWLADGVPIDVFKSNVDAYRNRLSYLARESQSSSICVVLNDPEMAGERDRVESIYRQRADELSIDVRVKEGLRTHELASLFETDHAFVHYIGHCETEGFRCPDGSLAASSIDESRVETFFLNACGSYYEGMELIERGSVAGAVTFTQVLNEHALKVGSTFAKLLVHGFSFERAMRLARRRIMMGKDYAVVGDGTHSLTDGDLTLPTTATIQPLDDGGYYVELECYSTRVNGLYYFPHTNDNEYAYLCGSQASFMMDSTEVAQFLREAKLAVIYDGDVYWSPELAPAFDD